LDDAASTAAVNGWITILVGSVAIAGLICLLLAFPEVSVVATTAAASFVVTASVASMPLWFLLLPESATTSVVGTGISLFLLPALSEVALVVLLAKSACCLG
jgi:hypothetical protein